MKQKPSEEEFVPESTTVWDFPVRGTWATHKPDYRGNFAPQIPRNLILAYSKPGECVLDPMVGSGTTLIEARLLGRRALGFDVNRKAVSITNSRLAFEVEKDFEQKAAVGDVRKLPCQDHSIDLVITHPPYANIISYSEGPNPKDLSTISKIPKFIGELRKGIRELFRVLKPGRYCCILIGDMRKGRHFIPLSHMVLNVCLEEGFVLKEEIIKTQHNTRHAPRWKSSAEEFGFFLIMHEHLFVFRKPTKGEATSKILYSTYKGFQAALNEKTE
jgi:DNA modification methylase